MKTRHKQLFSTHHTHTHTKRSKNKAIRNWKTISLFAEVATNKERKIARNEPRGHTFKSVGRVG